MLDVERHLTVRRGRIVPESYAAFSSFCHQVDQLEGQEIVVTRQEP